MRSGNETASFLHSREGVIQGGSLAMGAYGIGVIPLIKRLKSAYPDVTQSLYADNLSAFGAFDNIRLYFSSSKLFGPSRGYYPKPSKIVLIVHPKNRAVGRDFFPSRV